jgi:hypothetical protein
MNQMRPDLWRHAWRSTRTPAAFALLACAAFYALAQGFTPAADKSPPPPASTAPAQPTAASKTPRQRIELPKAERQALEAEEAPRQATGPTQADLVPSDADTQASPQLDEKRTRIEQVRTSNRISEIRVTPALTGRTYTITNREGRQPTSATDTSSNLSVPKFFTFEWGGTEERPSPPLPPPPSSSTPR